ncbi:MAG: nitroreductase family protein [Deltaproteobacteria bacterium]|nr:nitroreductase family protein [Deltaproteobacteria bacterium]
MDNEVIKAIRERRSIRSFKTDPIEDGVLDTILNAGSFAPTANGTQAWHITAIVGLDKIKDLDGKLKEASQIEGFDRYRKFVSGAYTINFKNAPVFIIVGAHRVDSVCPKEDGTLVLGNILLAAHAVGLGACWVNQLTAVGEEPGFRSYLSSLGFPATHLVIGSAAIGYPAVPNPKAHSRKSGQINVVR